MQQRVRPFNWPLINEELDCGDGGLDMYAPLSCMHITQ